MGSDGAPPFLTGDHQALLDSFDEARRRGYLGPGQDPATVVRHAMRFVPAVVGAGAILDLGSGGGVPGLVLAEQIAAAHVTLVDASVSRTDWLRLVVSRLGWADRVEVVTGRAEVLGHDPRWRTSQDAVVARGFAAPMVTAECAAGLLRVGGCLVVSEPPEEGAGGRWPAADLAALGLERQDWPDRSIAVLALRAPCPPEVPRARLVRGHTA